MSHGSRLVPLAVDEQGCGGDLLPSSDGSSTLGDVTLNAPFAWVTVEARRAVFRGCPAGYLQKTRRIGSRRIPYCSAWRQSK